MKKRKINRSKRISGGCGNHGSCPWCTRSRLHSNRRREPIPEWPTDTTDTNNRGTDNEQD